MYLDIKPWLRHICCLLFASVPLFTAAQQPLKLINSGEVIKEGIKLHDKSEFKKAIAQYRQVPEGDTNYMVAVNELVLSYMSDSNFRAARDLARKALMGPPHAYRRELMLLLGHTYDYMGKPDSAIMCYDSLIRMNPYDNQPLYEKGATYMTQKKYDKAVEYFQRSLLLNPYHFRSHYQLGNMLALMGRFTEAYLALSSSLFITDDANAAQGAIFSLSTIAGQTDEMANAYRNRKQENISPAYEEIDAIINSRLALSTGYKFDSKLAGDKVINTLHAIMEKLKYESGDDNFVMQYYVPLFVAVQKNESFDPMALLMFSGYEIEVVEKLAKRNSTEVKDMQRYVYSYLDKIVATQELNYAQRKKAPEKYAFIASEKIFIVGALKSKDPLEFNAGPVTLYKNGLLTATGTYNAAGKKEGLWKGYYKNGQLSVIQEYRNGVNVGPATAYHTNGNKKEEYVFDKDGKETESKEYSYNGMLTGTNVVRNGKKTFVLYHPNGKKQLEGTLVDDKIENGHYKYHYRDGSVSKEINISGTKWNGPYREYHLNGKIAEESNYKNGDREGSYTTYYNNGKVHFKATYLNGKLEGHCEEYDRHGTLIGTSDYHFGKKNGPDSSFSAAGKFYGLVRYKSDMPVAYYFVDEEGKVVAQDKDESGLKKRLFYYPNGNLRSDVAFKNGTENGPAKYYYSGGSLKKTTGYKNGIQEGITTDYYQNGVIKTEVNFKEGEEDGYFKHNYSSGLLSSEGWLKEGKKQGIWRYYNAAGKLSAERFFVNDKLNGPINHYFDNGKIQYTDLYDRDALVGLIQFDTSGRERSREYYPDGNGLYKRTYPNGKPGFVCAVKHGEYDGTFNHYLPNGILLQTGHFELGERDSTYESYSKNGVLLAKGHYRNNQLNGITNYYDEEGMHWRETYYENGDKEGLEKVWEKGLLRYEYNLHEGERDGTTKIYGDANKTACVLQYTEGTLTGYTYEGKDGKLLPLIPVKNGTCKIAAYYPGEKKSADLEFKESQFNGQQFVYYTSGQKAEERNFDKTDHNGALRKWTPAGKIVYDANYRNDENEGKESEYDSKGTLLCEVNYLEGGIPHGTATYVHPKTKKKVTVYYYYGQIMDAR